VTTDCFIRIPAIRVAEARIKVGEAGDAGDAGTWMYRFDHESPSFAGRLGAAHAVEIPYVFDLLDEKSGHALIGDEPPQVVADTAHGAWVRFVADCDPGTQERLRAAGSWEERFAIAEAALARRDGAGRAADPEVTFSWEQMVASRGRVRVERLVAETGWSRKRLWSRFRAQVGLTPKRAARLIRFDYAAHRLAVGHSAALVAAESGYADQSHLHRDVMAFAGVTPAAVAVSPFLAVDDAAWPPGHASGM
jgi:AraC-like DNA-binding protein